MEPSWTIERVKQELPDVPVLMDSGVFQGQVLTGKVTGRKCAFATVTVPEISRSLSVSASWQSLVMILNGGKSLIL
jgi:hypothetical protein